MRDEPKRASAKEAAIDSWVYIFFLLKSDVMCKVVYTMAPHAENKIHAGHTHFQPPKIASPFSSSREGENGNLIELITFAYL